MNRRGSGILLHLTGLPSAFGMGDLGPAAYRFADFLQKTRQSYWQILPLNPTDAGYDHSPYHSLSAFAGNPLLLSPECLVGEGLLDEQDLTGREIVSSGRLCYREAMAFKESIFARVFKRFKAQEIPATYTLFCNDNAWWLDDYSLFVALKTLYQNRHWIEWPQEIRDRNRDALGALRMELSDAIECAKYLQYLFSRQWFALKRYCNERGIQIIGDLPIYLDHDSADLWTHPELFKLSPEKRPLVVAGVPPDYFSETGQLWGNPIYNWEAHQKEEFNWWVMRVRHNLARCDRLRIDHFRGLVAYWEVPAAETTAMNGYWVDAPVYELFHQLARRIPQLPLIGEDLGLITADVREAMQRLGLPGMKVLLFAFGWDMGTNPYIPHNIEQNSVAYTGTHDNNTVRGWFENETDQEDRDRIFDYLGRKIPLHEIHWAFVRLAMMSRADTAIIPLQDLLGLGEEARMNKPTTESGNWRWRFMADELTADLGHRLRKMTEIYGRA